MSNSIAERILAARKVPAAAWKVYLDPDFDRDTHNPYLMKGMDIAVARLAEALRRQEKIVLFGDYDADGVPAVALMARTLRRLGAQEVVPLIPLRQEGYGLTAAAVERILAEAPALLITIDNGTVSKAEVAQISGAGIDVVICDHHEPRPEEIADSAYAILNPKQADCSYPFKGLCACGIVWKYLWALSTHLQADTNPLKWELDLVGLSTIADMVPLTDENHVLARYGLTVMRKSRNIGIRALAEVAEVVLSSVSAREVGFRIAPNINAPSRMHQETFNGGNAALTLLLTEDAEEARKLANYLLQQNRERQALLDRNLREAEQQALESPDSLCCVLYGPDWSTGVIGLVAGRMVERLGRPIIVLANEGEAVKGSVRCVDGVHALALLEQGKDHLAQFGGHAKAGGLTFRAVLEGETLQEEVRKLQDTLDTWLASEGWSLEAFRESQKRTADMELLLSEVTLETADTLEQLEPFGIEFPLPQFETSCEVRSVQRMGKEGSHLRCFLEQDGTSRKAVGFGLGNLEITNGSRYTVMYTLKAEEWQEVRSPVCFIERISEA